MLSYQWGNALISTARELRNEPTTKRRSDPPDDGHRSDTVRSKTSVPLKPPKNPFPTKQSTLPFPKPVPVKADPSIPPKQQPAMNRMQLGTLPFTAISAVDAEAQTKREFEAGRKDSATRKRNERNIKEKKLDAKRASAVHRQRECRRNKKTREISLGIRDKSGRCVRKTLNNAVSTVSIS